MKSEFLSVSLGLILGCLTPFAQAQEARNAGSPAPQQAGSDVVSSPGKGNPDEPTRRLPRYFASVVDVQQRAAIYAIQRNYREQIVAIENQLAALRLAEMSEMESVLTVVQRKRVEELRVQAAERAAARARDDMPPKPADSVPSAPTSGRD